MSKKSNMAATRVLLADPDPLGSGLLARALRGEGHDVASAATIDEARERLRAAAWDVVLADRACGGDALLDEARERPDGPAVILTDGFGSIADAVDAIRRGAVDYIAKPAGEEQVCLAVQHALERRSLAAENRRLRASLEERYQLGSLLTRDARMQRVFQTVEAVADTTANLLIQGESGTGKTMLAEAIHLRSSRSEGPFVEVNCGALPRDLLESELFGHVRGAFTGAVRDRSGRFEDADGGTLFLDEVATASPDLQVKLLRVLEDHKVSRVGGGEPLEVDVRVVAATNSDLAQEVEAGRFREDLYYRIHVIAIELPALRDRPADVPLLAEHFLARANEQYGRAVTGLSADALAALLGYGWPGNVRQLKHALERAVLLAGGPVLEAADLGAEIADADRAVRAAEVPPGAWGELPLGPLKKALEGPERQLIVRALESCEGNRQETASLLGINRTTLFNKMRKYELLSFPSRSERDESTR